MHDSQAMIPMMQRASASFDYFYDLADAAYDAAGTRAIAVRYRIRTGVERVFGMLKDSHGGCTVRVRGHEKVFLHLMFGILVIAAQKLIGIAQSIC